MERKRAVVMRRFVIVVCVFLMSYAGLAQERAMAGWFWQETNLATINGTEYSAEDFKNWWRNWREETTPLPESPDVFVEWQLLVQEATKMQLFLEPSYRSKVGTFLKVRSLMLLQEEEVNEKISVSDEEVRKFYLEEYIPKLRARVFYYIAGSPTEEKITALRDGILSVEEFLALKPEEGGPTYHEEKIFRIPQLQGEWRAVLQDAAAGDITEPVLMDKGVVVLKIEERQGEDPNDLEQLKGVILKKLQGQKADELTARLVDSLGKKFAVQVDEEVLAQVTLEPPAEDLAKKMVVSSKQGDVTAENFWASMQSEKSFREKNQFPAEELDVLKKRVLAGIVSQTVVSWEATDRHYEEKEPFKWVYRFYCDHRLNKEIERRLIEPNVKVEEAELVKFYQENSERFSHPEMVDFMLLEGDAQTISKMWQEISSGHDFFEVAAEHVPGGPSSQQMTMNQLSPELKAIVSSLRKGEMSMPFAYKDGNALLRLVNHREKIPVPFPQVREQISQELSRLKYQQAREELLRRLKEGSEISINPKVWNKLRKELANADVAVKNK
ncbi:MAG: peptidyl-prolyl cis-trans isomerase [Proteobacteria bacterium]|nr:peptidyl-prolyl cis-trans isomerase [Pseudomonadota bacterium]MBU4118558.1 peptidyl-prolyl cis-trans isomerase [Pseudomonadota bacterium]